MTPPLILNLIIDLTWKLWTFDIPGSLWQSNQFLIKANVMFFSLSWNSYSVSWRECWERETPTRLDMRSSSARTTASAMAMPHRLALAAHLPRPLTISSELNQQGEEAEGGTGEWAIKSSDIKQSMMSDQILRRKNVCLCVSLCMCVFVCVREREWKRDIGRQCSGGYATVKSTLEWLKENWQLIHRFRLLQNLNFNFTVNDSCKRKNA